MTLYGLSRLVIALVLAAGAGAGCRAETLPMPIDTNPEAMNQGARTGSLSIDEVFGLWAITAVRGTGTCRITLNRIPSGDHYGVLVGRCSVKDAQGATGWRPTENGFELLRAGAPPLRFRQVSVDEFESLDRLFRLTRAPTV